MRAIRLSLSALKSTITRSLTWVGVCPPSILRGEMCYSVRSAISRSLGCLRDYLHVDPRA